MADGASPTLPPKEAIAMGFKYFNELMEGQHTPRVLLEGLDIDDESGNWIVTFGFDSERPKPVQHNAMQRILDAIEPTDASERMPDIEILREFRSIHLTSDAGKFVKLDHA